MAKRRGLKEVQQLMSPGESVEEAVARVKRTVAQAAAAAAGAGAKVERTVPDAGAVEAAARAKKTETQAGAAEAGAARVRMTSTQAAAAGAGAEMGGSVRDNAPAGEVDLMESEGWGLKGFGEQDGTLGSTSAAAGAGVVRNSGVAGTAGGDISSDTGYTCGTSWVTVSLEDPLDPGRVMRHPGRFSNSPILQPFDLETYLKKVRWR
jgi:hypothetical protein